MTDKLEAFKHEVESITRELESIGRPAMTPSAPPHPRPARFTAEQLEEHAEYLEAEHFDVAAAMLRQAAETEREREASRDLLARAIDAVKALCAPIDERYKVTEYQLGVLDSVRALEALATTERQEPT